MLHGAAQSARQGKSNATKSFPVVLASEEGRHSNVFVKWLSSADLQHGKSMGERQILQSPWILSRLLFSAEDEHEYQVQDSQARINRHPRRSHTQSNTRTDVSPASKQWFVAEPLTLIRQMVGDPTALSNEGSACGFVSEIENWNDIILPKRQQSTDLIRHGKLWTSWIHCAVYYREFDVSHEHFWNSIEANGTLQQQNTSWLAIYFALLAVRLPPFSVPTLEDTDRD